MDGLSTAAGLKSITNHGDTNTGHCQLYPVFTADLSIFNHLMELSKAPMRFGQLSLQFEQWLWKRPPYMVFMPDHLMTPQFFGSPFKMLRLCPRLDSEVKLGPVKVTRSTLDDPIETCESCESCDSHRRTSSWKLSLCRISRWWLSMKERMSSWGPAQTEENLFMKHGKHM
jgi:hypothetical protein